MSFRKVLAYLFGHAAMLQTIAAKIYLKYGAELLGATPEERGEFVRDAVKAYLKLHYPEYTAYENVVVDFLYARIRKALEH